MDNIVRCAIYIRVSTDEQAKEGYSLEAQEERLRFFAKSQGWNIFKIYRDDGFSAKNINRPALKDLLYDAKLKKFNIILVYKIDRLSRSLKDLIEIVLKLNEYEIGVKSATETIDTTTPAGRLIFHQFGSFAQYERELISERTKFGMLKRLKQGYWNTTAPYGYKLIDGKLTIDDKESKMIELIFDLYTRKNMGVVNISKELEKLGYKPRNSKSGKWRANTIHNILTNPIYIGKVRWGGEEAEGVHKAIIEKDIFLFVQDKLNRNKKSTKRYNSPNNFLGIVKCGLCDSPMHIQYPGNEKKKKYKYYVCSQRQSFNSCNQEYIRADILENSIINELRNLSLHKKELIKFVDEYKKSNLNDLEKLKIERKKIEDKLKSIDDEKEKLYKWLMENDPTEEGKNFLNQKVEDINYKEFELKKKLWNIDDQITDIESKEINGDIVTNYLENFVVTYENLDYGEKKVLIENLIKEVKIKRDKHIRLTLQIPFEEFRVFIPAIVPEGINNRKNLILYLKYNLNTYYKSLIRKAFLSAPFSKIEVVI